MNTESNSKLQLIQLLKKLSDSDIQQLLAFVAGYEIGKHNQTLCDTNDFDKNNDS